MHSSASLQLSTISFFGRTLSEYAQFFALNLADLRGCPVLDVAGGPASFTVEAVRRGIPAVAVDPLYGCTADALAAMATDDCARMFAALRRKPALRRFRAFATMAAAEASRRRAARRFLDDYFAGFAAGRYVSGALPSLPFSDGQFDLVLCAHLLFTYSRQLDYAFHLAACRELMRVSRNTVRLHPLVGLDARPYPGLARLRRDLRAAGIRLRLITTGYEFFRGTRRTAVLERLAD